MKWLRTRFQRWRRRHREPAEARPRDARQVEAPHHGLMLLVHDASGPASYRLHSFADADSAAEFIQFWFPGRSEHGIIAFWAEHEEPPEPQRPGEVVVLVRDEFRREIVCPFSLPDMELARAWIVKEAARGLDLRLVLLYWAEPVRVRRDDWGRVRLLPHEPPSSRRRQAEFPAMSEEGALRLLDAIEILDEVDPPPQRSRDRPAKADAAGPGKARSSEAKTQTIDEVLQEINIAALAEEFDRLIEKRRWKRRQGPFRGFDSPPGKF